jgi:hypothetical protein
MSVQAFTVHYANFQHLAITAHELLFYAHEAHKADIIVDKVLDVIRKLTSQLVQGCDQGAAKF